MSFLKFSPEVRAADINCYSDGHTFVPVTELTGNIIAPKLNNIQLPANRRQNSYCGILLYGNMWPAVKLSLYRLR